jgi:hypothetical protein
MARPVGFFPTGSELVDVSQSEGISGNARFGHNNSTAKRVFFLPDGDGTRGFDKAYQYVKDILGYPEVKTGPTGSRYIARKTPHYINRFTKIGTHRPFLFAQSVDLKGMAPTTLGSPPDGNAYPEYKHFRLEVDYATLPYEVKGDTEISGGVITSPPAAAVITSIAAEWFWERYVTKIAKPAGEFFTIPSGNFKYVTAGTPPVTQGIGKLLSFCNLQVTWHQIPESGVPSVYVNPTLTTRSYIESTIGKVNQTAFNGYAIGSLLLLGVTMTPFRSPFGDRIYDVTYMFKYMEPTSGTGHNYIFRPASNAWLEVTTSGSTNIGTYTDGRNIYDWADFRLLFTPP